MAFLKAGAMSSTLWRRLGREGGGKGTWRWEGGEAKVRVRRRMRVSHVGALGGRRTDTAPIWKRVREEREGRKKFGGRHG